MKNKQIKYQFAYRGNGEIIDVSKVKKKEMFTCISCGCELIARRGKERVHHFAHKNLNPNCSFETYIHKLAKTTFYLEYNKCLEENKPFFIDYKLERKCIEIFNQHNKNNIELSCHNIFNYKKYDLTGQFTKISREKKDGDFIPDILMESNSGKKMYVEIYVTHKAEQSKINSKTRILELKITSENDIQPINKHYISFQKDSVKYYNFKIPRENNLCKDCTIRGHSFKIFKSKKTFFENTSIKKYFDDFDKYKKTVYSKFTLLEEDNNDYYGDSTYILEVVDAYKKGIDVIDCNLCRYHGDAKYGFTNVFCKFLKTLKHAQNAVTCKYFRIDKELIHN